MKTRSPFQKKYSQPYFFINPEQIKTEQERGLHVPGAFRQAFCLFRSATPVFKKFLFLAIILITLNGCVENDPLYSDFKNPPAKARPFVRWWWNGDCVAEKEIIRELDVMKNAGIGGVEINPIQMPGGKDNCSGEALVWVSPEWNKAVKAACIKATKNSMLTDLIVGSGWPFGGKFLQPGEIIQRVFTTHKMLKGPSKYRSQATELLDPDSDRETSVDLKNMIKSKILFIRLVPEPLTDINECKDLMPYLKKDGTILFDVPPGSYHMIVGVWQEGHRRVTHGAPGSDGPVLDHLNARAVRKYLDRLSTALEAEFGSKLGKYLRALFCDSIELGGANWTTDFADQFYKLCGYRLEPYLPFVFYKPLEGYRDPISYAPQIAVSLKRVRYDFNLVLVTLFLERFTETFKTWCHDHNTLCRYQAYGWPWFVGISEGYLIPDIPESNNWLNPNEYQNRYPIWNKYASSSGHIAGRQIISCEAMTNTNGVFKTSLEQIKKADDMNFITGINHSVLHGYNYSPPGAGFPGWVRYGSYFSEQNTWWPYFSLWSTYNARLSAVFQGAEPCAEIAILGPTADVWSRSGLERSIFHQTPWYCYYLWEALSHTGINADYINETMIQQSRFDKGVLKLGKMSYSLLVLADVHSVQPATAKKIKRYMDDGGRVLFINRLPSRSPSLKNAKENDIVVESILKNALKANPVNSKRVAEPKSREELISWTQDILGSIKVDSPVRILQPDANLFQIHYRHKGRLIVFFANQSETKEVRIEAGIDAGTAIPWCWDPETGGREVYYFGKDPQRIPVNLGPLESLLLVFENNKKAQAKPAVVNESNYLTLDSVWTIRCSPYRGENFQMEIPYLFDLGSSEEARLNSFAGTMTYSSGFFISETSGMILDLGKTYGVTEVTVNGQNLGSRWYGRHRYRLDHAAQPGYNKIEIKLTTTLYNYCRTRRDLPAIGVWLRASDPEPSGISGPVRIYSVDR